MSESLIDKVKFAFYNKQEVTSMSVVNITNPIAFDRNNNPSPKGLYDPAMGVSPYDRFGKCFTCGQQERNCPGHSGHINLELPLFNVLFINDIVKLMKAKCFFCHRFTITAHKMQDFKLMMKLVNLGFFDEFAKVEDVSGGFVMSRILSIKQKDGVNHQNGKHNAKNGASAQDGFALNIKDRNTKEFLKGVSDSVAAERKRIVELLKNHKELYNTDETSFKKALKYRLCKEFLKECMENAKCLYCKEMKSVIKKESHFKMTITHKSDKFNKENQKQKVLVASEMKEHIGHLFEIDKDAVELIYGQFTTNDYIKANTKKGYVVESFDHENFFLEVLLVTPNRFRPESKIANMTFLHGHTTLYTKVLQLNKELHKIIEKGTEGHDNDKEAENTAHKNIVNKWLELQETTNYLFDSSLNAKDADKDTGIKQILEKKEGIFRMKIMGKRVNYSCRSVISPDPYLETGEVGIPLFMAKKLTFPEPVNAQNVDHLRKLLINGTFSYPGAVYLEENGKKVFLEGSTLEQRLAMANRLLDNAANKTLYRNVQNGDVVLFNRQPTLHKPSLMSFKLRVLPKEMTIRMHYANCAGFNADFDGDEMNVHILQSYLARSEGLNLSYADKQYILSTNKAPVRGLIQDFVFSCAFLTDKEMCFERSDYCQLLYGAINSIVEDDHYVYSIEMSRPNILKPKTLWTGKQLFSDIINFVAFYNKNGKEEKGKYLNIESTSRVNQSYFCEVGKEEGRIVIRKNQLLCGIIDKNQIGASLFGLIHSFYELFGSQKTGRLFGAITRLCLEYMKIRGFTCGMADLMLTDEFEAVRLQKLEEIHRGVVDKIADTFKEDKVNYLDRKLYIPENKQEIKKEIFKANSAVSAKIQSHILNKPSGQMELDGIVKSSIGKHQSELYKNCLETGLHLKYPINNFSSMILTGAKGSVLNHNQISCNLGQQELEGKRVPTMASGKTLPCFSPYNPNPRSSGYIGDRFLSGLRTQEFFFHCMAGREGLVDTAVKTSRSGYLQRMLVKNLESLVVEYDYSVRDADDKSIIQYAYGDDCLDSVKVNTIENLQFLLDNFETIKTQTNLKDYFNILKTEDISYDNKVSTMLENYSPAKTLGAISEKTKAQLAKFVTENEKILKARKIDPLKFKILFYLKYFDGLITPGDCVGAIAAQSFGEPSTQMTLNTFHLAGHGGANVTLGVPRLRELLSTKNTKNIITDIPFRKHVTEAERNKIHNQCERVDLLELVKGINTKNRPVLAENGVVLESAQRKILYKITVVFEEMKDILREFGLRSEDLEAMMVETFLPKLSKMIIKKTKAAEKMAKIATSQFRGKRKQSETNAKLDGVDDNRNNDHDMEMEAFHEEAATNLLNVHSFVENKFLLVLHTPLSFKKLSMIEAIEEVLKSINIRSVPHVLRTHLVEENSEHLLQTEGLNFLYFWKRSDVFDLNRLSTNHVQMFTDKYGVG